jgi:hypothetical protein
MILQKLELLDNLEKEQLKHVLVLEKIDGGFKVIN